MLGVVPTPGEQRDLQNCNLKSHAVSGTMKALVADRDYVADAISVELPNWWHDPGQTRLPQPCAAAALNDLRSRIGHFCKKDPKAWLRRALTRQDLVVLSCPDQPVAGMLDPSNKEGSTPLKNLPCIEGSNTIASVELRR